VLLALSAIIRILLENANNPGKTIKMSRERKLTELEACVLGLIKVKGPCTPYVVRKEFEKSPTPHWSGSTGAIYPLFRRLKAQHLIKEKSSTNDNRGGKLYVITGEGDKALEDWLYQALTAQIIGTPPDPLRNRVLFLGLLSDEKRKEFLFQVKEELEAQLKNVITAREDFDQKNFFDYLQMSGTVFAAQARLDWIVKITEILEKQKTGEMVLFK
jgi:DNA-binding PadR family transcriptional regulator